MRLSNEEEITQHWRPTLREQRTIRKTRLVVMKERKTPISAVQKSDYLQHTRHHGLIEAITYSVTVTTNVIDSRNRNGGKSQINRWDETLKRRDVNGQVPTLFTKATHFNLYSTGTTLERVNGSVDLVYIQLASCDNTVMTQSGFLQTIRLDIRARKWCSSLVQVTSQGTNLSTYATIPSSVSSKRNSHIYDSEHRGGYTDSRRRTGQTKSSRTALIRYTLSNSIHSFQIV